MTTDLGDLRELLELASEDVPDLDLAPDAEAEARRRGRAVVRRSVLAVGGVAALGVAVVVVRDRAASPAPAPTTPAPATVAPDGRLSTAQVDGVPVFLAPIPRDEALLPRYADAARLAIPRHLGPADRAVRGVLGPGGVLPGPVRAVFLVVAEGGGYHAVFSSPDSPFQLELESVRIEQRAQSVLGPRSISGDRHRLVVPQPGRVLVVDARDASVVEVPVPDPTLDVAGWARDRTTVVARGRDADWLIDPATGSVTRSRVAVAPDWADLVAGEGGARLRSFSGVGELTGEKRLLGPPLVPSTASVASTEGWVAGGAFLPGRFQGELGRSQGLVAVHSDLPPVPRVLAAASGPLVPANAYRALGWGPRAVVLLESRSERAGFQGMVRRVLAWDVNEGLLHQVADVDRASSEPGSFSGTYSL